MHASSANASFDIAAIRREFPITQRMLYFDSAHQSPLAASVKRAIEQFLNEAHETAGPKHQWLERVEMVRLRLARFLGAEASEIAFTKNTSEGLNIAAHALSLGPGDNVLMVAGDHPNNAYAFLNLRSNGVAVRFVPYRGGALNAECFVPHVDKSTRAISLSHVAFHSGHVADIADLGRFCASKHIRLVVDAMQSVGVLETNVAVLRPSMMAFGCHKGLLVPQGLGALYVDKSLENLKPAYLAIAGLRNPPGDLVANPNDTELKPGAGRFELGNFNLPIIHGLGAALDLIEHVGIAKITRHALDLGDRLLSHLDELSVGLVGPRARSERSHILVLDLPVEAWLKHFRSENVRVSPERGGIRVSFGLFNSLEEVDRLAEVIHRGIKSLGGPGRTSRTRSS